MRKCLVCGKVQNKCRCCPHINMNRKGQTFLFSFMLGLTIIILALALAFPLRESADTAMNASTDTNYTNSDGNVGQITSVGLDCTNSSISSFDKISCYATDTTSFFFIGSLIMIAGIVIGSKIIFN